MQTRLERDSLGERAIPKDAYYGVQTDRAVENFPISGLKPKPAYIDATVQIKKAAATIIVAYKMNGVELPPKRGFPFQLVAESKWGYKWIKWITSIEVSDDEGGQAKGP